jgi:hypothetical protein
VTQPLDHQVLNTVVIGNLTGTRVDATAALYVAPNTYGDPNAWTTGTLDMTLYTLIANVVAVAYVISGHDNYVGGPAGTYHPTLVAEVLDTVSFGAVSAETGIYHEAATTEVEDGIFFGPGSTYEGSYAGGGVIIVED